MTPEILITLGDPLGIGTEVTLKALRRFKSAKARFVLLGSRSAHLPLVPKLKSVLAQSNVVWREVPLRFHKNPQTFAGRASLESLKAAVALLKNPQTQALITAPISKTHILRAGCDFPGHTEFLCDHYKVKHFAMMLFCERLRVVLMTIHKPLRAIFSDITAKNLKEKLRLTTTSLQKHFNVARPKIAVCGLNPHASENGRFGDEEKTVLSPALKSWQKSKDGQSALVFGPLAADTVFHKAIQGEFDAVICHYHDQALIPIKTIAFDSSVNMTLGLPFLRTSPDHGTAFDIAGRSLASETSMLAALQAALRFLQA